MTLTNIDRYDEHQVPALGQRAIVVGGSVAGLCAARVLHDSFDEVVVLERDEFPVEPRVRDGAPQTSQPHTMLEAGRMTLEDFFPGFSEDVQAAGGLKLDMSDDFTWYDQGNAVATADADLHALYASRPLFEHIIRERVRALSGVRLQGGCYVRGYEHDADENRVTGVRLRDENDVETTLNATLIIDATGRNSRTPTWLENHGYPIPDVDKVTVDITYSTVRIERPPDVQEGVLIAPETHRPRGAAMLPVERNQWEVVFQGLHGEQSPADFETFLEWAETFPLGEIERQLREQDQLSEIQRYPFPSSIRRHYHALPRFPDGLLVTGDAIASFNPIYGQGMSVAALDALVLHHELADGLTDLELRFFRRTNDIIGEAWKTAVGKDFVFDQTTGPKPFGSDLFNKYVNRLIQQAHDDGNLTEAFFRVFRLERPVTSLLRPSIVWRVLRPRFGPTNSDSSERRPKSYSTSAESTGD